MDFTAPEPSILSGVLPSAFPGEAARFEPFPYGLVKANWWHGPGRLGAVMPEISRFMGVVIAMYYNDHAPPHFHARHGEHEVRVLIETGGIMSGWIPQSARKHVLEWLDLHRSELMEDWRLAEERKPLRKIKPLE